MSFVKEIKEFAMRGNVIDLAVGVVIGAAFGRIVSSLVDSIVMRQREFDRCRGCSRWTRRFRKGEQESRLVFHFLNELLPARA